MITVRPEVRTVFVRGLHSFGEIADAIREATGKRFQWARWSVFAIVDDQAPINLNVVTGMPFSPPDAERESVGFKLPKP